MKLGIGQMSIPHNFVKKIVLSFWQPICKDLEWEITRSKLLSLETGEKFLDDSDPKILKQSSEAFLFEKMRRYLLGRVWGLLRAAITAVHNITVICLCAVTLSVNEVVTCHIVFRFSLRNSLEWCPLTHRDIYPCQVLDGDMLVGPSLCLQSSF